MTRIRRNTDAVLETHLPRWGAEKRAQRCLVRRWSNIPVVSEYRVLCRGVMSFRAAPHTWRHLFSVLTDHDPFAFHLKFLLFFSEDDDTKTKNQYISTIPSPPPPFTNAKKNAKVTGIHSQVPRDLLLLII